MDYIKLSKEISYVLRHNPEKYNLKMDLEGNVNIDDLLNGINSTNQFKEKVTKLDLIKMLEQLDKQRFKIENNSIKALYGHTINLNINKDEIIPPQFLFHGTTKEAYQKILESGIKKMKRQYVHLAKSIDVAFMVGRRRTKSPIILKIDALGAYNDGIKFYDGGDDIYLVEYISPKYIINIEKS